MKFDPITGELISDVPANEVQVQTLSKQGNMKFDPVTGELVSKSLNEEMKEEVVKDETTSVQEEVVKVENETVQEEAVKVENETVQEEAVKVENETVQEEVVKVEVVSQDKVSEVNQPSVESNAMSEQQSQPEKKKKSMVIALIGAAVALVAVLVIGLVASGVFLGPAGKISKATIKTFREMPHFVKDLQALSMLYDGEYALGVTMGMEEGNIEAELRSKPSEKQIYAKVNMEDISEITLLAGIDKKEVKFQIPELLNQVFVYNFKSKNDGYLMEELDEEDIEIVNTLLEEVNADRAKVDKIYAELAAVVWDELNSLEFEKTNKKQYRVDGEKRDCSGYITEITEDNMINIIDGIEEVVNKHIDDDMNEIIEESGESIEELFDDMRDVFEDMDDIELSFYLYKGMLACINLENTDIDSTIKVLFKGGDYRVQNMEVVEENKNSEYSYEMKGSISDSTEKFKFIINNKKERALVIEYDYKKGDFTVEQDSYSDINIRGNLKSSASEIAVKFDKFVIGYDLLSGIELKVTLSDKVKMGKYSGKEFDIGNASEEEFEDLGEDLEDAIYDNDMEDLMDYF